MKQITIILNGSRNTGLDKSEFEKLVGIGFKYEVKDPKNYETSFLEAREKGNAEYEYIWHKKRMLVASFETGDFEKNLEIVQNLNGRNSINVCVTEKK